MNRMLIELSQHFRAPIVVAFVIILGLCISNAHARVIRVPADYPLIKQAVAAGSAGDTVRVAAGTYTEHDISLKTNMRLEGAGSDYSVIDGQNCGYYRWIIMGANGAQVEGFTISGNTDSLNTGIFSWITPMKIRKNKFQFCLQPIAVACAAEISHNVFADNIGYGVFSGYFYTSPTPEPAPTVSHNIIYGSPYGAIVSVSSSLTAVNNTLVESGYGIWIQKAPADSSPVAVTARNNILGDNNYGVFIPNFVLPGIDTALLTIEYNDVWNNVIANYGGWNADSTDISADPLFVGAPVVPLRHYSTDARLEAEALATEATTLCNFNIAVARGEAASPPSLDLVIRRQPRDDNFDYNLSSGSPCIDAGDPNPQYNDPNGSRNDIGALPYLDCGDLDVSGIVDVTDAVFIINFIFGAHGTPPQSISRADMDCNGRLDITDAVFLISYIFGSGPAPCASCP